MSALLKEDAYRYDSHSNYMGVMVAEALLHNGELSDVVGGVKSTAGNFDVIWDEFRNRVLEVGSNGNVNKNHRLALLDALMPDVSFAEKAKAAGYTKSPRAHKRGHGYSSAAHAARQPQYKANVAYARAELLRIADYGFIQAANDYKDILASAKASGDNGNAVKAIEALTKMLGLQSQVPASKVRVTKTEVIVERTDSAVAIVETLADIDQVMANAKAQKQRLLSSLDEEQLEEVRTLKKEHRVKQNNRDSILRG